MLQELIPKIGPSILGSDLSNLHSECQKLIDLGADYMHLDVMDGVFVPNMTFGHPVVRCLRKNVPSSMFETHMMVINPEKWAEPMANAGTNLYTFHLEACDNAPEVIRKVKETGMKVGLAIKPATPVTDLEKYIDEVDAVLIMTVEPGFGGQTFMYEMLDKVRYLREKYPFKNVGVDGGVGLDNIYSCAHAGANMIVAGTSVTGAQNPGNIIQRLRTALHEVILGDDDSPER